MQIQMLFTPQVITFLVMLVAVPLAIYFGLESAEGKLSLALWPACAAIGFALMFGIPHYLWVASVGAIFMPASIPGLPIPFKPYELIFILLIGKFLVEQIIFGKRWFSPGPFPDCLFLFGLLFVLLFHGVQDRFAMRIFGSTLWGGRAYIAVGLSMIAYFVIMSSKVKPFTFQHLPLVALLFGTVDFSIKLITLLFPSTAAYLFWFYGDISMADNSDSLFATRWGFLANYGYLLMLWGFSTARLNDYLTKMKLLQMGAVCLGLLMCFASGYRSSIAIAGIMCLVVGLRDLGWRSIIGLAPVSLLCAAAIFVQTGWGLPKIVQRGLTFLPAPWDADVILDSDGSNEFREKVWRLWLNQQFPKAPALGRGFGLPYEDMLATLPFLNNQVFKTAWYGRDEAFVISGNIHNGLLSVVDRFGLVGGICFLGWMIIYIRRMAGYLRKTRHKALDPPLQWLALYLITFSISFLPGALRAENFMVQQLFLVGAFFSLLRATEQIEKEKLQSTQTNSIPNHEKITGARMAHPSGARP